MSEKTEAEQLDGEVQDLRPTVTFGSGEDAVTVELPRKWKRLKLLKAMKYTDIWGALEAIWPPVDGEQNPVLDQLEEADLDDDDLVAGIEQLGQALGGTSSGNSSASPA